MSRPTIATFEDAAPRYDRSGAQVTGLDLSEAMLRRTAAEAAALGFGHVSTWRGDAARPPFAPAGLAAHPRPGPDRDAAQRAAFAPQEQEKAPQEEVSQ